MTLEVVEPKSLDEAIDTLVRLTDEFPSVEFVFRGQSESHWRLQTSYDRYWGGTPIHDEFFVDRMVSQFQSGVTRLGLDGPLGGKLDWLEYARHHGLPAPLLDFTWSPFIALFFAFDGVREVYDAPRTAAIYCLNLNQLAKEVARERADNPDEPRSFQRELNAFLHEGAHEFETGFPQGRLLFLRYPNTHTRRMHVQMGTFLYSTKQFGEEPVGPKDLDDYFHRIGEGFDSPCLPNEERPVLLKLKLPHTWVSQVFSRLEVMGITGSSMYLSAEGVARDVYNSFNFHPRAAFLRDC